MSMEDQIKYLKKLHGRLPERQAIEQNTRNSYLYYRGNSVFFRPMAVSGTISSANAGSFIEFGLGFSYDGLRSHHGSIRLVSGWDLKDTDSWPESNTILLVRLESPKSTGLPV